MTFSIFGHNVKKNLSSFLKDLNKYHANIKSYESNKELDNCLDLTVSLQENRLSPDLYMKPTERNQYLHYPSHIIIPLRNQLFTTEQHLFLRCGFPAFAVFRLSQISFSKTCCL